MKKYIRTIGLTLIIGFILISCTKEVDILEPNLLGLYKYKSVFVPVAVDLNKDGISNNNLILEGGSCVWDNSWQYQQGKVILREGKTFCGETSQEADENNVIGSFDYVYNQADKTIKITYEGGSSEILSNVKLGYTPNQKQSLSFDLWDEDIQQIVTYYLEEE